MNKRQVVEQMIASGVVPVIRADSPEEALAAVEAVCAAGVDVVEVTMTVPGAVDLIRALTTDKESNVLIGAGTVLDAAKAEECIAAGAQFIVSPAADMKTIAFCVEAGVAIMPGSLTPTEILNSWNAGADIVKVFPAGSLGGPVYLKSIKAPLPHIKLMPTGGVNLSNAAAFIRAGASAIGVGADLVDLTAIRDGRSQDITANARKYLDVVKFARKG